MTISLSALVVLAAIWSVLVFVTAWGWSARKQAALAERAFWTGYNSNLDGADPPSIRDNGFFGWMAYRGWTTGQHKTQIKNLTDIAQSKSLEVERLKSEGMSRMTIQVDSDNIARALSEAQDRNGSAPSEVSS